MSASAETALPVILPALSEGMAEGTIVRWLVPEGAAVTAGQPIVEVETDKATTELEAGADGPLWHRAAEGDAVAVGAAVAVIGADRPADAAREPVAQGPAPREPAAHEPAPPAPNRRRPIASPLARRVAAELGVDLPALRGSGLGGRIVRADVLAAAHAVEPEPEPAPAPAPVPAVAAPAGDARGASERIAPTRVQLLIADRMVRAKTAIPDFSVAMTVDVAPLQDLRASLRAHAEAFGTRAPSVNDMVIKACALALREHPEVNSSFVDGVFLRHERVNVGMAVATDGSLVVPTIFDADRRGLGWIGQESRRLAGAVRDGTISAPELAGGTFTVSNLGMFGVTDFTAVINPPQAAILAVGAVEETAVVRDGALAVGQRMKLTLTSDHRIIYGATAAAFLGRVRELLEQPWAIVL
jgi:pyruvate dehydrogenase E2 component (dihydrolipoamide acetyltransferase)